VTEEEFNLYNKRIEQAQGLKRDIDKVQEAIDRLTAGYGSKLEIKHHAASSYNISFCCSDIFEKEETEGYYRKTMRRILISALTQYKQELEKKFEEI